jgi:hypothetical protein
MFASKTPGYNAERLIGTSASTAQSNFGVEHPLFKTISALARLRRANSALRDGEQQVRAYTDAPWLFAVSRLEPQGGSEVLIAFNTSMHAIDAQVDIDPHSQHFHALHGDCAQTPSAPGSYRVRIAALDYLICASGVAPY